MVLILIHYNPSLVAQKVNNHNLPYLPNALLK
jgi:hypothetical protein